METLQRQLMSQLIQLQGAGIASIDSETNVDLLGGKKNPMKGKVTKVAEGANVMFFTNSNTNSYRNMIHKRLTKEGKNPENFKLSKRVWGERVPETPFVQHKGEFYVEAVYLRAPKSVKYYLEGQEIAKEDIQGLKADKPKAESQGGLDDKVVIRTFKLKSILAVKMGELSFNV